MMANSTNERTARNHIANRAFDRCRELAEFTDVPGTITRTFLSPATHGVHLKLSEWMIELQMEVRVDAMGNLRGLQRASQPSSRRLLIGSHIDTVPCAGAFDGVLGVTLALALIEARGEKRTGLDIEVVAFSEEEGVRFKLPFLGSRALIGEVDEVLLSATDSSGVTVRKAIEDFGIDPSQLPEAAVGRSVFAYLEFHIEQGPVLDDAGLSLGIVEAVAGQSRLQLAFRGQANHAGTTPMRFRKDALPAAAELILLAEQATRNYSGLVATVGAMTVLPGATNVVPGEVQLSLDVRHSEDLTRQTAVSSLLSEAKVIAQKRHLSFEIKSFQEQQSVQMDDFLISVLSQAANDAGHLTRKMTSGAGHDAMILAKKVPTAMVFLRSPGGISHHPDESVLGGDVLAALETGLAFLDRLDRSCTTT